MAIREKINRSPAVAGVVAAVVILAAGAYLAFSYFGAETPGLPAPGGPAPKSYFTTDDGATFFPDDATKVPPFKAAGGKVAVRAAVYKCGAGQPFVNHLERYNEQDRRRLEQAIAQGGMAAVIDLGPIEAEVKRPKERAWVTSTDVNRYNQVIQPKCPPGDSGQPVPVTPPPQ